MKEVLSFNEEVLSSACCMHFISFSVNSCLTPLTKVELFIFSFRTSIANKIVEVIQDILAGFFFAFRIFLKSSHYFFMQKLGFVHKIFIHLIHLSSKLNFSCVLNKKFHSIKSNAFRKSANSKIPSILFVFSQESRI